MLSGGPAGRLLSSPLPHAAPHGPPLPAEVSGRYGAGIHATVSANSTHVWDALAHCTVPVLLVSRSEGVLGCHGVCMQL